MRRPITASTRIAGVVGHPVRHSLSPAIHNAWIEAAGLDAVYLAFAPRPEGFGALAEGFRGGVVAGLNVTIPFKEEALALADRASPAARAIGAANVLVFGEDGAIEADNTDGAGLMVALAKAGFQGGAEQGHAVVLGAGGAARSAVTALLAVGAARCALVNRTLDRARAIAGGDPRVSVHGWSEAAAALQGAAVIVNATSLGMTGQAPLELDLDPAPTSAVVMDMVYRPLQTDLLKRARDRGHPIADGLDMLIAQAGPSFTRFFDAPVPDGVDVRALCVAELGARA